MMTYLFIIVGGIGISAVAITIIFSLGKRSGRMEEKKAHTDKVIKKLHEISESHQTIDKKGDMLKKNKVKGPWLRGDWPVDY